MANYEKVDMIRFRNPGTSKIIQIEMLKALYAELKDYETFSLDDMANVFAYENLMSAAGFSGENALIKGYSKDRSRDTPYNNAKMYAEIFRTLGWMTSAYEGSSYPVKFTYIGMHIATINNSEVENKLYLESILGIIDPNEIMDVKYSIHSRIVISILESMTLLDNFIYKHEIAMGPMSINDNLDNFKVKIMTIKENRKIMSNDQFKLEFENFSKKLGISPTTVDNSTRMPVALLKHSDLVTDSRENIYGVSKKVLRISELGQKTLKHYKNMKDIRLSEFNKYSILEQNSLIRIGIFSMLERADYDISKYSHFLDNDKIICEKILNNKELLFSPYQMLKISRIEMALNEIGIVPEIGKEKNIVIVDRNMVPKKSNSSALLDNFHYNPTNIKSNDLADITLEVIENIDTMKKQDINLEKIIKELINKYDSLDENKFYPLVSDILSLSGLNCKCSRAGNHSSRWDAIIEDVNYSIPIEIKSPSEEKHLGLKAIRQALENKVMLLSRKTYITDLKSLSLVIGFKEPTNRTESEELILAIKDRFNINIGLLDFQNLIYILINSIYYKRSIEINDFKKLGGIINVLIDK